jgi:CHASE3 domain sensor protein
MEQLNQQEPVLKIEMTLSEANTVIQALAKLPFEQVVGLIQKVKGQGDAQMHAFQQAQSAAAQAAVAPAPQAEEAKE